MIVNFVPGKETAAFLRTNEMTRESYPGRCFLYHRTWGYKMKHSEKKHYSYFSNKECEYFPCHKNADPENFNCLFCYCPLYVLGENCGGAFQYSAKGYKDCSKCLYPHRSENYERITARYSEIVEAMKCCGSEKEFR